MSLIIHHAWDYRKQPYVILLIYKRHVPLFEMQRMVVKPIICKQMHTTVKGLLTLFFNDLWKVN